MTTIIGDYARTITRTDTCYITVWRSLVTGEYWVYKYTYKEAYNAQR